MLVRLPCIRGMNKMDDEIYMLREELRETRVEIQTLRNKIREMEDSDARWKRHMSEALNSGDGVYRP